MTSANFWSEDWMKLQRQYWEQLNDFSRKAMGSAEQAAPSWPGFEWDKAMQQWWQTISSGMPDANRGFMDKILEQGNVFVKMNEELVRNLDKGQEWPDMLNNIFEQLQNSFANQAEQTSGQVEDGFNKLMGFWQSPMENWRQFSGFVDINNNFLNSSNLFEKLLNAPGLGYTREDEERYKQLAQAGLHYQHAMLEYNKIFANMGTKAVATMQAKVRKLAEKDQQIESGRALYDLWVAACEEVYAELTLTPEYAKVHGELVNALMSVKKKWEELIDQRLGMFNMPTRKEMRTLQTRLQESRREVRSLQCELNELKDMVAALKQEVLKTNTSAAPVKTAAKKKRVVKKKAASRKPD
jgi:class III poly(R)-hydroxyalkanoic acid synthase PhaE subunit